MTPPQQASEQGEGTVRPRRVLDPRAVTPALPRPGRRAAGWLAGLGAVLAGLAWLAAVVPAAAAPEEEPPDQVERGTELYQRYCAVCHASDGSGVVDVAPPITGFSAPRVDLSMRTHRMPLADPARGVRQRTFTPAERRATMAYLTDKLDLDGEIPDPEPGQPGAGQEIYAVHCAQCHGASGKGGVAGDGVEIPAVVGLDPVTVAEATREGPFAMPQFGAELVSDEEIGHIVAFLDEEAHEPTTPLGLASVSKFEAIGFAALLTVAVLLVCAWAGGVRQDQPTPPPRARGDGDGDGDEG